MLRADVVVYDAQGQLIAVVEVKRKIGTSPEWAANLRRNIMAHGAFQNASFFLLATPDKLYFWKNAGTEPVEVRPSFSIEAPVVLAPYFERAGLGPEHVSEAAFELVVGQWLADLARADREKPEPASGWLRDSGFLEAIRAGRVEYEAAA